MSPIAFVTPFTGGRLLSHRPQKSATGHRRRIAAPRASPLISLALRTSPEHAQHASHPSSSMPRAKRIAIVAKAASKAAQNQVAVDSEASSSKGFFGLKAQAYWDSMGALPLFFTGFGVVALAIKMLKMKRGEMRSGSTGVNKVTVPKTAITSEEEEAELHVFKCGGCGYEMYPARGREFKFFPDSFKCPLCGTPKSEFWDLNDPDDPRNQQADEDDDQDDGQPGNGQGQPGNGHGQPLPGASPSFQSSAPSDSAVPAVDASDSLPNDNSSSPPAT